MTTTTGLLGELVTAVHEGIEFYEYAANRIGLVALRVVFDSMASVRQDLVLAVGIGKVDQHHSSVDANSLPAASRKIYQTLRNDFHKTPASRIVAALVKHETILLEVLHDGLETIRDDGPARLAEVLRVHLQRMGVCLEELERLHRNGFA